VGKEIERKFKVDMGQWQPPGKGRRLRQGYLCLEPGRTVRVRIGPDGAWLTVKGPAKGLVRDEFEYAIPTTDAEAMLARLRVGSVVEKTRYEVPVGSHLFEVDIFHGDNAGLVVAEVELDAPDEPFPHPPWLGEEVTDDPRYLNARLAQHPYREWPESA
jgi:adenylate cyclase